MTEYLPMPLLQNFTVFSRPLSLPHTSVFCIRHVICSYYTNCKLMQRDLLGTAIMANTS